MVTGIVIPHEINFAIQSVDFQKLSDYQSAVGGYIEIVHMDSHPLAIVADEDGKVKRLPINKRATSLWGLLAPHGAGGDILVGDVVILGADEDGDITDASMDLMELLLDTAQYQVKVCLSRQLDTWVPIGDPVEDFFDAAARALTLMAVWNPPDEVKVVAAD